jgi:EmrB/QacA subfamily drug resistance transporter
MSMTPTLDQPPDAVHDRRWLILGVLCLSLLLIVMDNTIVNVALPTIQGDLDASTSDLQWIVDAYVLVFAGLLLTAGALGDKFGRRGALSAGLVIMGVSAGLSALADDPAQLVATRAVMGVGGALVMPATLSILTNVFADAKERAQAIAIWAGTAGIAVALGPITGGWLLEHFWWGSVFLINIPVVVVALVAGKLLVPTSRDPSSARFDPIGAVLSIAGLSALVWSIISAGERGWTDPVVVAAYAVAAVLLVAFVVWERHTPSPMLDVSVFANRRFSSASGAITVTFFALIGAFFLITQYLQFVLDYSPLQAGIRLLPMAGVMVAVSGLSAKAVEAVGTKVVVGAGLIIAATGLVFGSLLTPGSSYVEVAGMLVVLSFGMALTMAPATESIMGSLPPAKAGVGSAVNDTTRELGGALGVAVLGSVLSSAYSSKLLDVLAGTPTPPEAAEAASEQLGAALAIADEVGGGAGAALAESARSAFVDGMGTSLLAGAGVALLGAVSVFLYLPSRASSPGAPSEPTEDPGDDVSLVDADPDPVTA